MILFIDFDGVLHPQPSRDEDLFIRAPLLWKILGSCPAVEVVFSTSWRHMCGFDQLVHYATAGGGEEFAHRFIGTTPSILQEEAINVVGPSHRRYKECRLWVLGNSREPKAWLAIDDDASTFPASSANLYLTDSSTGLTELDVGLVIAQIHCSALSQQK